MLTSEWVSVATYRVRNKPNSCIRGTTYHNERANGIEGKTDRTPFKGYASRQKTKGKKKKRKILPLKPNGDLE